MPPKRKSTHQDAGAASSDAPPPRRSTRQRTSTAPAAAPPLSVASTTDKKTTATAKATPKGKGRSKPAKHSTSEEDEDEEAPAAPTPVDKKGKQKPAERKSVGQKDKESTESGGGVGGDEGRQYWLMRAEPETRLENGVDVSFSIDDLAAKTEPEPWDGIRNYVARNNLRAMKKGDLAFFSHSNCKEPGIVGTMEIVQEHSPDLTAHDPKAAYYDPKSSPSDPKWSVVHVEFRSKFAVPVTVKEMREMAKQGGPLENMQMMKQSRLSVSRVSEAEWEHLMGMAENKAKAIA